MKKIKLIVAAVAMLSLVSSSAVYADGFAPGEGMYVGAFAAVGMWMVQPKITTQGNETTTYDSGRKGGIFEATEGGLGLSGHEMGAYFGYGYKMGDLYVGFEGESAWGDVEFKLTSSTGITSVGSDKNGNGAGITSVTATKDWTSGGFGRIGYYVNKDTLLSFKGGVLASKFDVKFGSVAEDFYAGGPSFGLDLSSRLTAWDPNLSVRMGAVYTDFMTAPVTGLGSTFVSSGSAVDSEVTGSALSARVGLQYSFFDANSLF